MAQINQNKKLKIKKRKDMDDLHKVLIYGLDKSGKSTFAEKYCKEHQLKALVIDVDNTNYTDMDLIQIDTTSPQKTNKDIISIINALKSDEYDYDTIILDGVTGLLARLTGVGDGMFVYSERGKMWNMILRKLTNSNKHLIFIGQIDMQVKDDGGNTSQAVIHTNSIVNEKYKCYTVTKGKDKEYFVETEIKREKNNKN